MNKSDVPSASFSELKRTARKYQDLSIAEIHRRLDKREKGKRFNLEQKVLILKLLQLNEMSYTKTSQEVGMRRETLYGDVVFTAEPDYAIAKRIETDIAIAQGQSLKEWYDLLDKSAKKLGALVDNATGTRSIYAIVEAVKASTEVIKLNKELSDTGKVPGADFFMNVHQMMVNNIYGDGNED